MPREFVLFHRFKENTLEKFLNFVDYKELLKYRDCQV
jgi:hypothetical protein